MPPFFRCSSPAELILGGTFRMSFRRFVDPGSWACPPRAARSMNRDGPEGEALRECSWHRKLAVLPITGRYSRIKFLAWQWQTSTHVTSGDRGPRNRKDVELRAPSDGDVARESSRVRALRCVRRASRGVRGDSAGSGRGDRTARIEGHGGASPRRRAELPPCRRGGLRGSEGSDREAVRSDLADGFMSEDAARSVYGLEPDGGD